MKHLSLKLRISLLFTVVVAGVSILALTLAAEAYWNSIDQTLQENLINVVEEEAFFLQTDYFYIDALENNSFRDTDFLVEDIRILIYDENGNHIAGMFLKNDVDDLPYSRSDHPASVTIDGKKYYYFDEWIFIRSQADVWIRGVVRAERSIWEVLHAYTWLWILIPAFLILAFAGGYLLTGLFLRPIKRIDDAAENIYQSGDLSTRIQLPESKDEISALAAHINRMLDRLEDNFEAQKQFASNVSHELRTPVSVILAQCEYAIDNATDQLDLYQVISAVQKQGYKMSGLIESLLLFTRISQDTDRYRKEETDISSLVLSACEDFRLIAEKEIEIGSNVPAGITAVVNRDLFSLMLNNLIQNAIRYGKEKGHVNVTLEKAENHMSLIVADDGEGISPEDLPHIWDLFYRGDKSRSSKGTGLGLALVKQIVEFHKGKISVESEPEKGSIFKITL